MKLLQSLYVSVVIALGFVLLGSFASQAYYAGQQRDLLHRKAQAVELRELPPIEEFVGPTSWEPNYRKTLLLPVEEFWNSPAHYVAALVSGLPLALRVATLLMILSLILAILLWPRLCVISKARHSFDSLLVMSVAYLIALSGYVFTWVDYSNLAAKTNSIARFTPFNEGEGNMLIENAISRVSVGILITSFSVLLVCRIMADVVRTFQRWREVQQPAPMYWRSELTGGPMLSRIPASQPRRYRRQSGRR